MKTRTTKPPSSRRIRLKLLAVSGFALLAATTARADYQSNVLASHPVGYWPLNPAVDTQIDPGTGNYIATDLSGHGNFGHYININPSKGQGSGGPSGYLTNSVIFNGVNTYVDLGVGGNTALLDVVGAITMEAWVQATIPQESGQYGLILSKGYDLAQMVDDIDLHIISTDGNYTNYYYWGGVYTSYDGLNQQSAQGAPVTTNWQYVVATWTPISGRDGLWSLYVDGALAVTNAAVGPALYAPPYEQGSAFTDPWAIGNGTADGANGRLFSGKLSHVALYTNALTAADVLAHYNLGIYGTTNAPVSAYTSGVLASHPVGYWPLDLAVDTKVDPTTGNYLATDLSGHGNFGHYINISPSGGQSSSGPSQYMTNSVIFDGANTYVDLSVGANTALLDVVGAITMEAWVQATIPQAGGQYGLILSKGYDLNQMVDDIDLHIISTDGNYTNYYYWGGIYSSYESLNQQAAQGAPVTTNWQHVVATWTPVSGRDGLWSLYVDGALAVTNAAVGPALYAPPYEQGSAFIDPWAIGNGTADGANGRLFSGKLSHVALYTNALTAADVQAHYNLGIYGTATLASPALSVERGATGTVVISWPGAGYTLQSTPSLSSPTWADAPSGTSSPVTVTAGSGSQYFRLRK